MKKKTLVLVSRENPSSRWRKNLHVSHLSISSSPPRRRRFQVLDPLISSRFQVLDLSILSLHRLKISSRFENVSIEAFRDSFGGRDLDESLQKAFRRYLAVRGIKGPLYDSLHEYLANKDDREYITWLKNLKEFVAK